MDFDGFEVRELAIRGQGQKWRRFMKNVILESGFWEPRPTHNTRSWSKLFLGRLSISCRRSESLWRWFRIHSVGAIKRSTNYQVFYRFWWFWCASTYDLIDKIPGILWIFMALKYSVLPRLASLSEQIRSLFITSFPPCFAIGFPIWSTNYRVFDGFWSFRSVLIEQLN